jgi:hypothetical protein
MLTIDFGTLGGLVDSDREAVKNYEDAKTPLVLSQSPFNRQAYCKDLAAQAAPKIDDLQKGIAAMVYPEHETVSTSPTGQAARIAEIEEQLKNAIPQGLLDMMAQGAVISSARLLYYEKDKYLDLKPSFRTLARQIIAHSLFAADETQKQISLKKEATIKEKLKAEETGWQERIQEKKKEAETAQSALKSKDAKIATLVKCCKEIEAEEARLARRAKEAALQTKERLSLERKAEENAQLHREHSPLCRQEQEQDVQIQELQKQIDHMQKLLNQQPKRTYKNALLNKK